MNVRGVSRTAVGIFVVLFCFSMKPCVAQEEIKLTKSITMLPDRPSGIAMITKFWNPEVLRNYYFVLTFLTPGSERGYFDRVLAFEGPEPIEFRIWEGGDCSFVQTLVFRVRSKKGPKLVVGTAARTGEAIVNGQVVKSLSDPSEQRIRIFVPKEGDVVTNVSLSAVAETVTEQKLCEAEEVRQAIRAFVREQMATLTSQQ